MKSIKYIEVNKCKRWLSCKAYCYFRNGNKIIIRGATSSVAEKITKIYLENHEPFIVEYYLYCKNNRIPRSYIRLYTILGLKKGFSYEFQLFKKGTDLKRNYLFIKSSKGGIVLTKKFKMIPRKWIYELDPYVNIKEEKEEGKEEKEEIKKITIENESKYLTNKPI
jgi:hypothetical protein